MSSVWAATNSSRDSMSGAPYGSATAARAWRAEAADAPGFSSTNARVSSGCLVCAFHAVRGTR